MPNLEIPVPYEIDKHDLELIKPSQLTKIKSLFIKKEALNLKKVEENTLQIKPIRPEPLKFIDILEERKEKTIDYQIYSQELEQSEKEILSKLSRL